MRKELALAQSLRVLAIYSSTLFLRELGADFSASFAYVAWDVARM